jgi:hypothetical protein
VHGSKENDVPIALAQSQLAVLPGTTHVTLVNRADWLAR